MVYHHFVTTVFENVDENVEIEMMVPSQTYTKNLKIMRSLERQKIRIVQG